MHATGPRHPTGASTVPSGSRRTTPSALPVPRPLPPPRRVPARERRGERQAWQRFDAATSDVDLTGLDGEIRIEARFDQGRDGGDDSCCARQLNEHREFTDLCGFWEFRADGEDRGRASGWSGGFADGIPIAVPASWNDQLNHLRDFLGPAWYQTSFVLPPSWRGGRMLLRFGSVNYLAEVWLNDRSLGGHEGGHLPFGFDATAAVRPGRNLLVVRVDGSSSRPTGYRPAGFPPTLGTPSPRPSFPTPPSTSSPSAGSSDP